jgi:hypothetical protein
VNAESDSAGPAAGSIGRYEIIAEIGRGGMAVVHLARQRDLDRLVALKALHSIHSGTSELAERFLRESRLAGSLNHPNIVTVHEYFEEGGTPYIAMEYVPQGSLRPRVGEFSIAQIVGVLEGILAGLSAVEPSGIVHRDLKPENVMVTADGRVKIADFGIAKANETANYPRITTTKTGTTMGTPAYMAPEQVLGDSVGPWTDLYSVGIMAYEQLVGHVPFDNTHVPMAIMFRHLSEPIPAVVQSRPTVDASLSEWVGRLLVKEADKRTRSPTRAWEELEEIVIGLLGPRWRREARLPVRDAPAAADPPLARQFIETAVPSASPGAPLADARFIETAVGSPSPARRAQSRRSAAMRTPAAEGEPGARGIAWGGTRVLGAVLLVAAAAVLVGYVISPAGGTTRTAEPLTNQASSRALAISYPANWRRAETIRQTPGLQLTGPLGLTSSHAGGALVVGESQADGPTLLPTSFLSTLPKLTEPETVRLGGLTFRRYRDLEPTREAKTTEVAYVLPTTAGVVSALCTVPRHSPTPVNVDCERILGSLKLTTATALPLGPIPAYASALRNAVTRLDGESVAGGLQLSHAKTAAAQAAAAKRLARADEQALAALRRAIPGPAERVSNASLLAALTSTANAYASMAAGARGENAVLFDQGRKGVAAGTAAVAAVLRQFSKLGYGIVG